MTPQDHLLAILRTRINDLEAVEEAARKVYEMDLPVSLELITLGKVLDVAHRHKSGG